MHSIFRAQRLLLQPNVFNVKQCHSYYKEESCTERFVELVTPLSVLMTIASRRFLLDLDIVHVKHALAETPADSGSFAQS